MKKYKLIYDDNKTISDFTYTSTVYRIQAIKDFGNVKKGEYGGYIESENSLSHTGNCWVADNACVFNESIVRDNAIVSDNAQVHSKSIVSDNAIVKDNAIICNMSIVRGNATVSENAYVDLESSIYDNATITDNAFVCFKSQVYGNAILYDKSSAISSSRIYDNAILSDAVVTQYSTVHKDVHMTGHMFLYGAEVTSTDDYTVFYRHWSDNEPVVYSRSNNYWHHRDWGAYDDKLLDYVKVNDPDGYSFYKDFQSQIHSRQANDFARAIESLEKTETKSIGLDELAF